MSLSQHYVWHYLFLARQLAIQYPCSQPCLSLPLHERLLWRHILSRAEPPLVNTNVLPLSWHSPCQLHGTPRSSLTSNHVVWVYTGEIRRMSSHSRNLSRHSSSWKCYLLKIKLCQTQQKILVNKKSSFFAYNYAMYFNHNHMLKQFI